MSTFDSLLLKAHTETREGTPAAAVEVQASTQDYGRFIVEPLEAGLGVTIGNALRRVLLSSLPGAAVTAVRVEGVQHEFSTLPHVKEDVIEFLLNVKDIRLRPLSSQPGRLLLEAIGEGEVSAGDIRPSADFEVVNPELHLATLDSPEGRLNVELYVETGKGYRPAGRGNGLPIGVIPVDAIFTPVRRVNYSVEKTRVGEVSNLDRLVLEVWTDGSVSATEVVSESAQILMKHLSLLHRVGEPAAPEKRGLPAIPPEHYEMPLEELGLSARTLNALRRSNIIKVGEVLEKGREELLRLRSFGEKSLEEVWEKLAEKGLLPESEMARAAEEVSAAEAGADEVEEEGAEPEVAEGEEERGDIS